MYGQKHDYRSTIRGIFSQNVTRGRKKKIVVNPTVTNVLEVDFLENRTLLFFPARTLYIQYQPYTNANVSCVCVFVCVYLQRGGGIKQITDGINPENSRGRIGRVRRVDKRFLWNCHHRRTRGDGGETNGFVLGADTYIPTTLGSASACSATVKDVTGFPIGLFEYTGTRGRYRKYVLTRACARALTNTRTHTHRFI